MKRKEKGMLKSWAGFPVPAVALTLLLAACASAPVPREADKSTPSVGSYHLVGIGPGDGDLMTPRALKVLSEADVIYCDREAREAIAPYVSLRGKEIVEGYGRLFPFYGQDCSRLPPGESTWEGLSCREIQDKQAQWVSMARQAVAGGRKVAMTSEGDPTLYGPASWTLDALRDLNPVVVPGMSTFNAANGALQVSLGEVILTAPIQKPAHRDTLESLAGHDRATMVIFMPRDLKGLMARLARVHPAATPVAVVSHAGRTGREKTVFGTLQTISGKLQGMDAWNSLVYVGKAVGEAPLKTAVKRKKPSRGRYFLVGVGPGDPDLASLRALQVIEEADLVFAHPRIGERFAAQLAGKTVMEGYHRLFPFYGRKCSQLTEAERSREDMSCEEYHRKRAELSAMVRKAVAEGKTVAMLDNGDPMIYGPCSWTLTELRDLGPRVVPGLSSFNAANAALAKSVTDGAGSHSVLLASGWSVDEMAVHQSTMVLFTMRTEFRKFIDSLSRHYPPETPVAIVSNAGYPQKESVTRGELGTIWSQVGGEGKLPFEHLLYVGDFLAPRH